MTLRTAMATFLAGLFGMIGDTSADEPGRTVRVMSFNVRYGTAADGPNHWDRRKEFLAETVRAFDPDLLGTQETLAFQRDFLAEQLDGYDHLGAGRDDGGQRGEMTALFWKRDRFEKLDGGHFWLSPTPEVVGSKGWDAALPRMATWVRLRDRRDDSAGPLLFLNTHFDHRGATARAESARLIRGRIKDSGDGCSLVLTGDFNAGEGSAPYAALFAGRDGKESPLVDTFRAARPQRGEEEGTFNGFDPSATGGARIDWIGASRDWGVTKAGIDRTVCDGRVPSDHFPVFAVLSRDRGQ